MLSDEGWSPLTVRREIIEVKGQAPETFTVRSTPRGPLFSDLAPDWCPSPVSIHWTGMEESHDISAYLKLNAAASVDDVLAARPLIKTPPFNMAAADSAGNIATIGFGSFPTRDGRPGLHDPAEYPPRYIPPSELPVEHNPARGWIASANGRIVGADYPYALRGLWEPRFRVQRIGDMLDARAKHSPAEMQLLQLDQFSLHAQDLTPPCSKISATTRRCGRWKTYAAGTTLHRGQPADVAVPGLLPHWLHVVLALRLSPALIERLTTYVSGEAQFAFYDRLLNG